MKPRSLIGPALLLLTWCDSAPHACAAEGAPPPPAPPAQGARAKTADPDFGWMTDLVEAAKGTTDRDQEGMRARIMELRARIEAGDPTVAEEVRAIAAELRARAAAGDPNVRVTRNTTGVAEPRETSTDPHPPATADNSQQTVIRRTIDPEEAVAKIAEMRARAVAGDPTVTVTTYSTSAEHPMNPEELRAKLAELRARAAAGDPNVKITTRSTGPRRAVELTEEERARRQAYVASHPDLRPSAREAILAGLFLPAMTLADVEQLLGPLQPIEGRLPDGTLPDADTKVYLGQEAGRPVYLFFRDGKLLRR